MLAANAGVPYADLEPLLDNRHMLVELDRDETWWKVSDYVNKKLGLLLAIRSELDKTLAKDREARTVRVAMMRGRDRKASPRG
jgi:hypothetical protein